MEYEKLLREEFEGLSLSDMQIKYESILKLLDKAKTEIMVEKIITDSRTRMGFVASTAIQNEIYALMSGLKVHDLKEPMKFAFAGKIEDDHVPILISEDKKGFKGANNSHQLILNKQRRRR